MPRKNADPGFWSVERDALRPPEDLTAAEWSNRNIVLLSESSREPGRYSWRRAPYQRDLLNLAAHPDIRHLVLKTSTQVGKTLLLYIILAHAIDQDPFPCMVVYPADDVAREVSRSRLQPLFEACPPIKAKIPADSSKYQLTEMHFPGAPAFITGSNSASQLAQRPIRLLARDEINKFPDSIKDAGNPLDLSEERLKGFWDIRKIIDVSSPTTENGAITRQEGKCQVIVKYFVPCPHCHRLQTLEWPQIKWDDQKDLPKNERIQRAKDSAFYECRFCQKAIGDESKDWMLDPDNGAGWFDMTIEEPVPSPDPIADLFQRFREKGVKLETVTARLWSAYSPWIKWGDIVEKFLDAHLSTFKRFDKLRSFTTDWKGEEYKDTISEKAESDILNLRCEYPPMIIPAAAIALTCGIDCQKSGFYFVVRAWARDGSSWLIRYGFLLSWGDITRLIYEDTYPIEGSTDRARVWRAGLDTGGGEGEGDRSMTEEAYRWLAQYQGNVCFGVKGSSREMIGKMKLTQIGTFPGKPNVLIPGGGVRLWVIDTAYFKDVFHARMQVKAGDPGACYLHSEAGEDYARMIVAEEKKRQKDGRYLWEHVRGENHYLDAEVYAAAMVDPSCFGGLAVIPDPKKQQQEKNKPIQVARSQWMNR